MVKNLPANAGEVRETGDPWMGKVPWSRKRQPFPVLLPEESFGQRSLVDYSPWDCKKSDMTKAT